MHYLSHMAVQRYIALKTVATIFWSYHVVCQLHMLPFCPSQPAQRMADTLLSSLHVHSECQTVRRYVQSYLPAVTLTLARYGPLAS